MEKNHSLYQEIRNLSQTKKKIVYRVKTNIFNNVESKTNARHVGLQINTKDLQCRKLCLIFAIPKCLTHI